MSWLARSLVNSLRGEEEDEDPKKPNSEAQEEQNSNAALINEEEKEDPTRGVKEDLSELTKTLSRQFWGVASFLAPPPASGDSPPSDRGQRSDPAVSDAVSSPRLGGIRNDFAEIGGRFKSGISILSSTKAVTEISKIASTLLPFADEEEEESDDVEQRYGGGAVGVTDEVILFVRNISMHPETWLDFPLFGDEDDYDEFDVSDAQQEHALAVERHAPRLAALRIELCPSHMSEGRFWKIYFVLLHSKLSRQDAELLTTPQIVQAREMLLPDVQSRGNPPKSEASEGSATCPSKEVGALVPSEENVFQPLNSTAEITSTEIEESFTSIPINDPETEKHPIEIAEMNIIDKSVIEEDPPVDPKVQGLTNDGSSNTVSIEKYEDDGDEWLQEEDVIEASGSKGATLPLGNDEDVSFSDLEEDDDDQGTPSNSKAVNRLIGSRPKDSKEESNDWLSVDDLDEEL